MQPTHSASKNPDEMLANMIANASCLDDYDPNAMSVDKARQYIRQFLSAVTASETVPLQDALGRVLAADILSPANVPNYDNSAMDGYAFQADIAGNQPTQLKVVGTVFAGKAFTGKVSAGECVRIMTGGMMPEGTNTVIVQEKVQLNGDSVNFAEVPSRGMNVRYAGEDLQINQVVLPQGHLIHAADLGLIASLGIAGVTVYRPLKVAFFSTGDELVSVGQSLKSGQVYDSNRYTLFGMLSRFEIEIIDLGAIPDQIELLEATLLKAASQADVVITSGGVSVGEADFMKQLLAKHGQVMFWKIAMKPGRPLAYGKIKASETKSAHYFGLPGNPVAVMVTFYQFVREALLIMMGQTQPAKLPMFDVVCTDKIKKMTGRTEFQRGICYLDEDGVWKVKPTGAQGSAMLSSMSRANCFIVLDESVGHLAAGATVKVQVLEGFI
jgi:molybdopterin molybdotransferase